MNAIDQAVELLEVYGFTVCAEAVAKMGSEIDAHRIEVERANSAATDYAAKILEQNQEIDALKALAESLKVTIAITALERDALKARLQIEFPVWKFWDWRSGVIGGSLLGAVILVIVAIGFWFFGRTA